MIITISHRFCIYIFTIIEYKLLVLKPNAVVDF